ncbi:MAG TPA: vWA domain-containing protein [Polyangiaceae bacterium]|nr:vWA domain-containing protein [Polyangiaceae bacterium]
MVLSAYWRKTLLGGLLVGCAGVTLQCGGSAPETPLAPGGAAGTANGGTAGSAKPTGGAAGSPNGNSGDAGSSQAGEGDAGEVGSAGSSGSATAIAGSGGKASGTGGVGAGGTSGSAGAAIGGHAGLTQSAGAGGSSTAGSAGTGGSESSAGNGGATSSAGSGGAAGSAGTGGSVGASGSAGAGTAGGASGSVGASGSAGAGTAGGASGSGGAAAGGASGSANVAGSGGSGGACSSGAAFRPRAPVVYFLLDRSSSMFLPTDYWSPLKASVLATISAFTSQIRFGLAAYTGVATKTCPLDLTSAGGIALDNYAAINQLLTGLASPGDKAESPTAAAIATIRTTLAAESGNSKTIFLLTDGGHDFCNDSDLNCPADALVAQIQSAFAAGIRTSVFGIKGAPYLDLTHTQAEANAGSGAPVVGDATALYWACNGQSDWRALWTAKGSPPQQALGNYVSSSTTNTPYTLLDTTQPDTMTSALKAATAALRSCTYDLTGAQVNQSLAAQGVVRIDGTNIPMDATNGWRLNSATELELVGNACAAWHTAASQTISFDFPCSILSP